MDKYLIRRYN